MQEARVELVQRHVQGDLLDELSQQVVVGTASLDEAFDTAALLLVAICLIEAHCSGRVALTHEEIGERVVAVLDHLTRKH